MPKDSAENSFDILIAGAGFAGSLTALILHQLGFKVCLVEKNIHPRFAIGESSTPIADMILRDMAKVYDLPWLKDFSRYGSWQQNHPDLVCGLKRGFSYFKHFPNEKFHTGHNHKNELLVAASVDDTQSDTNWLRADFDHFLVKEVKEYGINYFDNTEIISIQDGDQWRFQLKCSGESIEVKASFFIDATGSPALLNNLFGIKSFSDGFLTDSYAVFSHFNDVVHWSDFLLKQGISAKDYPYNPDHSALHQVLEEGWIWMLRFNDDRLSMGMALDRSKYDDQNKDAEQIWIDILNRYPSIKSLASNATIAKEPGKLMKSARLQRITNKGFGKKWVALPHTIGFVDPLHSTGIAHALTGVEKVIRILKEYWEQDDLLYQNLRTYEKSVFAELKFVDLLVAGCYKTLSNFDLFNAWSMLYFTAAIAYEQRRMKGEIPDHFLEADNSAIKAIVNRCYDSLQQLLDKPQLSTTNKNEFIQEVRKQISPYNIAGLLDPSTRNMYHHTAVNL